MTGISRLMHKEKEEEKQMKLILARHGQTDWNLAKRIQGSHDIELNATGIKQAEQLSNDLIIENYEIKKIYSSTQKRARVTADIISKVLNVQVQSIDGLQEMNFGLWEGLAWEEIETKFPLELNEWINNRRYIKAPKGESYEELLQRVVAALKKIISNETETVLIVTHGAVIMSLQAYLNNTPFEEMLTRYGVGNASTVMIDSKDIH